MTNQRLASLALAAALVLVVGLLVRGRLERSDQPPPAAPPSEALAMQRLSHEGLLRRATSFAEGRAAQAEPYLVFLPARGASGIRWRADTLVFVGADHRIGVARAAAGDSGKATVRLSNDAVKAGWVLVVGKGPSGAVLSLSGALGGVIRSRCDSREVEELMLNVPLTEHFAGAGVFDIDGTLVGMVAWCGRRLAAISAREIPALLPKPDSADAPSVRFGMSVTAMDSIDRAYFGADSGALVVAVRKRSEADAAGIRPGDVLLSVDSSAGPDGAFRVNRLRGRDRAVIRLGAPSSDGARSTERQAPLGIDLGPPPAERGVAVTDVAPGSIARAAGLRAGDRITRIGTTAVTSRAVAERLLRGAGRGPVFIAFERDSVEHGVLVRP